MTVNKRSVPLDRRTGIMLQGGRWIAYAGCAYVVAYAVLLLVLRCERGECTAHRVRNQHVSFAQACSSTVHLHWLFQQSSGS